MNVMIEVLACVNAKIATTVASNEMIKIFLIQSGNLTVLKQYRAIGRFMTR
jgi:hypothetical protein